MQTSCPGLSSAPLPLDPMCDTISPMEGMESTEDPHTHHWYDQFVKTGGNSTGSSKGKKHNRSRGTQTARQGHDAATGQQHDDNNGVPIKNAPDGAKTRGKLQSKPPIPMSGKVISVRHLFDTALDDDARDFMEHFDDVVQHVLPANKAQAKRSRSSIRELSHSLTDERGSRHKGYMNDDAALSPYTRYFVWWNLVRLTRLFKTLSNSFCLQDGDTCLDLGSGPLTVPIALWLSSPELRKLRLTWVCQDISQGALDLGKDLFMAVSHLVPPDDGDGGGPTENWQIITCRAHIGQPVREVTDRAALVTCANVLNELQENEHLTAEEVVERYGNVFRRYTASGVILLVEPGVPPMAHVLSLLREQFLQMDYCTVSPCPHRGECPMNGEGAHTGGRAKWCNFAFDTTDAPAILRELSADAGLVKRRAVLSYLLMQKGYNPDGKGGTGDDASGQTNNEADSLVLRITSDPIYLPNYRTGHYACSRLGLTLVIDTHGRRYSSGDEITMRLTVPIESLGRDKKTGAVMLYL